MIAVKVSFNTAHLECLWYYVFINKIEKIKVDGLAGEMGSKLIILTEIE